MAQVDIADEHHFIRYCEGRVIQTDDNGVIVGIFPQAMELKTYPNKQVEQYLSGSYYEYHPGTREEKLKSAAAAFEKRLANGIKSEDALVVMNAGEIRARGEERDRKLRVLHEKKAGKEDYASIRGLLPPPNQDSELCQALATLALRDTALVASIR